MGDAPTQVGVYRVLGKVGEGGMGTVYEAAPATGDRHVAIKILHPEHARSEEFLARFFNEARVTKRRRRSKSTLRQGRHWDRGTSLVATKRYKAQPATNCEEVDLTRRC